MAHSEYLVLRCVLSRVVTLHFQDHEARVGLLLEAPKHFLVIVCSFRHVYP